MSKSQITPHSAVFCHQLEAEGYRPHWNELDQLVFKRAGLTYLLRFDALDPQFLEIVLPNLWTVTDAFERSKVLFAINEVNSVIKVVKLVLIETCVRANFETFIANPSDFGEVLQRGFNSIDAILERFTIQLRHDLPLSLETTRIND